jgi:hypothetical protein
VRAVSASPAEGTRQGHRHRALPESTGEAVNERGIRQTGSGWPLLYRSRLVVMLFMATTAQPSDIKRARVIVVVCFAWHVAALFTRLSDQSTSSHRAMHCGGRAPSQIAAMTWLETVSESLRACPQATGVGAEISLVSGLTGPLKYLPAGGARVCIRSYATAWASPRTHVRAECTFASPNLRLSPEKGSATRLTRSCDTRDRFHRVIVIPP